MKKRILALALSVSVAFSGIPASSVLASPAEYETVVEEATVETSAEETGTEETSEEFSEAIIVEEMTVEEAFTEETSAEETLSEETVVVETSEEVSTEEKIVEEVTEEASVEETSTVEEIEETTTEEITVEETVTETVTEEEITVEGALTEETTVEKTIEDAMIKAVGSNGIVYEGVAYLSANTYGRLSQDAQAAYIQMCDSLAQQKEMGIDVTDAVISIDKKGNLSLTASVPAQNIFMSDSLEKGFVEENLELARQVRPMEEVISDGIPAEELGSLLTDGKYFRKQLTDSFTLMLYDQASSAMVSGGRNSFSFSYSRLNTSWIPICDALSALVLTYPNKFNWADWGKGKLRMNVRYGSGNYSYTYSLDKSKHYTSSLETQANKKVKELVNAAYEYAAKSYANAPTYGIIKYFDNWICKNNYYNKIGLDTDKSGNTKEYFYCHSAYGVLLKGYGVCESYALAMSRLLDAAGIRNMYVVGYAGGGHAWNYVEMPDGKWYMVDSTWNDGGSSSNGQYLLCGEDGVHKPQGARWIYGKNFKFPSRASGAYGAGKADAISINYPEKVVKPKATFTLKIDAKNNPTNYYKKYKRTWSSSDKTVAKVNSKGQVTAVAPGKAVITCTIAGKKVNSTVYVYQFSGNKFADNDKTTYTWNYGNPDTAFTSADSKTFTINVGQKNGVLTAAQLADKLSLEQPKVKSNKPSVAEVSNVSLKGDKITFKVTAKALGSAVITVNFAGKKSTLNVRVAQAIKAAWFDFSQVVNVEYNGKTFKPKVTLSDTGKKQSPKVTFKVTYANNKNAGKATVIVSGTGRYAGDVTKEFTIAKKDASAATFNKCTTTKTYNGVPQAVATTVKLGKTTLKAGVDYDVLYDGSATAPTKAGKYKITIKTKGNYKANTLKKLVSGTEAVYEIKATTISKVKVSCPAKIKSGATLNYKVKIGKNELPTGNYTVSFTDKDGKTVKKYTTPGTYKLVITIKGSNVLPKENKNGTKTSTITKTFKVIQ